MRVNQIKSVLFISIIIMIVSAACGPATQVVTEQPVIPTAVPEKPTEPPEPTATEVPSGLVTNLTDLKKATIQIQSEGTFIDPEFGYMANAAGRGSGFIIDPSGIAITNHVVTGAALLQVWVVVIRIKVQRSHRWGIGMLGPGCD
jgi:serine protease Do